MAYDFFGSWSGTAGHHAALHPSTPNSGSGTAGVEHVLKAGFPAGKILLGIPVYGRSFLSASKAGERFEGVGGDEGTFEYKTLPRPGTTEVVDGRIVAASCVGGDGGFVSYDNPETVRLKAEFCKKKGLGGLFYWTGTADMASGPRSLVEAGFTALHAT